jgi:hypothetical protein
MPRLVILIGFLGGCFFDAGYSGGTVKCSDGRCPSGLVCHLETCVTSIPIDMAHDVAIDAPPAALTCASPGPFAGTGTTSGTTVGATSKMSSACGGFVMNGPDRVYVIPMDGTQQLQVAITGARKAYVLASPCVESPNTPACLGGTRAIANNPIVVTPPAGNAYVVVDDENAAASSTYTLTLTVL